MSLSLLNYKIVGKREETVPGAPSDPTVVAIPDAEIDVYDVEWRHDDGPVTDTVLLPVLDYFQKKWKDEHGDEQIDFIPARREVVTPSGVRSVIMDTIRVKKGSAMSVVVQILEEKRPRLAANLGVKP